jgi:hypothetical protein
MTDVLYPEVGKSISQHWAEKLDQVTIPEEYLRIDNIIG